MFDFFQAFLQGIVMFATTAFLSLLLFLPIRSYIRDKLETWILDTIHSYIQEQLKISLEHPEDTAKLLSPLLGAIIKEVLKNVEKTNKPQTVNLLGFKLPVDLVQLLISRFVSGNASRKETNNPFA